MTFQRPYPFNSVLSNDIVEGHTVPTVAYEMTPIIADVRELIEGRLDSQVKTNFELLVLSKERQRVITDLLINRGLCPDGEYAPYPHGRGVGLTCLANTVSTVIFCLAICLWELY